MVMQMVGKQVQLNEKSTELFQGLVAQVLKKGDKVVRSLAFMRNL